jgi:anti-sigma factor RsiW
MNDRDDLNWTAFRYVAGELDDVAAQAFESRLESDQEAREAVARVVALTRCVARVGSEERRRSAELSSVAPARPTPLGPPARRSGLMTLIVTAALLVLVAQIVRPRPVAPGPFKATQESVSQDRLAEAWDAMREPLDEPLSGAEAWEEEGAESSVAAVEMPLDEGEPYWIEAAVIGLSAGGSDLDDYE